MLLKEALREMVELKTSGVSTVKLARILALSEQSAELRDALSKGTLDDPFSGWKIVKENAHRLGPRYEELLRQHVDPGHRDPELRRPLKTLSVNASFLSALLSAGPPAFAMGMASEGGRPRGMFALHIDGPLPNQLAGFQLGHALLGKDDTIAAEFTFEFYGFAKYQVLVNPASPVIRACLKNMVEDRVFQFFVFNLAGHATGFRSEPGDGDVAGLAKNWPTMLAATTTADQFKRAEDVFARRIATGTLLNWVCRGETEYMDLSTDTIDLTPHAD